MLRKQMQIIFFLNYFKTLFFLENKDENAQHSREPNQMSQETYLVVLYFYFLNFVPISCSISDHFLIPAHPWIKNSTLSVGSPLFFVCIYVVFCQYMYIFDFLSICINADFIKPYRSPVHFKPEFGKVLLNGLYVKCPIMWSFGI